jgi:hypothetical protein
MHVQLSDYFLSCRAGDLGFDPLRLLPQEAAGAKDMKTRELNNGRLGASVRCATPAATICRLTVMTRRSCCVRRCAAMIAVVLMAVIEEITHAKTTDLLFGR